LFAGGGVPLTANAAAISAVNQCNGLDNAGGLAIECDVTVTNHLNIATGVASASVTVRECHGAANAGLTCTSSTTPSTTRVLTVTQCNGSGSGGGGTVTCTVHVINRIVGATGRTGATINQCIETGTGGGVETVVCTPLGSTTGATITQCNGSGNGGGGALRVLCTVTPSSETALMRVIINQCNGSGNGGGSVVICTASETNTIITAEGSSGGGGTGSGSLPTTGVDVTPLLASSLGALIVGLLLLLAVRRQDRHHQG
jgi:LPXTG-motif cell wall-anchored protein